MIETAECEGAIGGMGNLGSWREAEDSDEEDDDEDYEDEDDDGSDDEDKEGFMNSLQNFLMNKLHLSGDGDTPKVSTEDFFSWVV